MQLRPGQVAVITGAASGIGRSLAHASADRGMKLVLADLDKPGLDLVTAELRAAGTDAIAVPTDVCDAAAVEALRDATLDAYGAAHLVCNNAGVGTSGSVWEAPVELWRWVLDVDLWSVIHGVRTFVPLLLEQGEGHIVNTASAAGLVPVPQLSPYVVAKHGVVALSENLDGELAGTGVGISVLCPAFVRTRIHEHERLAPDDLRAVMEGPTGKADRDLVRDLVESGLDPDDVARLTLAAVEDERLYILTHPATVDRLQVRMQRILDDFQAMATSSRSE